MGKQHCGNPLSILLAQMVSFTVSVVPANESDIKLHKGVVNGLVWEAEKGNASPLVSAVQPGATLTNVALFIDSNKESLHPAAATEDWCAHMQDECPGLGGLPTPTQPALHMVFPARSSKFIVASQARRLGRWLERRRRRLERRRLERRRLERRRW